MRHREYFLDLTDKVKSDYKNKTVFPHPTKIFRAFNITPVDCVKVVILGQDPYHGRGQAHGLAFSVPKGTKIPPSLTNIYKELKDDNIDKVVEDGDLSHWAKQGVLLLNTSLTVISGQAGSHSRIGWQYFTDAVISKFTFVTTSFSP